MFQLIQTHLKEMFSVIYTPTEGEAIQNFSNLFRNPDGCFLNIFDQNRVHEALAQWGSPEDIDYIVVTDGEAVSDTSSLEFGAAKMILIDHIRFSELVTKVCKILLVVEDVSDGSIGVGSILISVAKLVLATLCAGVHPNRILPVVLDCGTDVGVFQYLLSRVINPF